MLGKVLGWIAVVALGLTLGLTIMAILVRSDTAAQFLELTKLLLSWEVIGGAAVIGAGLMFRQAINQFITTKRR